MTDPSTSFGPPRGMRDFYPEDMAVREVVFEAWRSAARRFGFVPYDACVVESLDLLKRKAGEEIVDQIYAFTDKSGRELALRPEMTPTLARMVASRHGSLNLPIKWFAIAQCFRYERMSKGRKREHYQWNLDVVGEESVTAEAEVVAAACEAMALLGFGAADFRVHYSSRALLADIFLRLGISAAHHQAAFLALDKRGKLPDADITALLSNEGLDEAARQQVFSVLDIHSVQDAADLLGHRPPSLAALESFAATAAAHGLSDRMVFDISVVRGLAYYTGIVFEAFDIQHKFRALFGGGRYANLLRDIGGKPETGVGLGFGDVVVADLMADSGKIPGGVPGADVAIGYMTSAEHLPAIALATRWRKEGRSVDLALAPEKARHFFARAAKAGCRQALYIGPDDVAGGKARLKNLATREEQECALG